MSRAGSKPLQHGADFCLLPTIGHFEKLASPAER